MQKNLEQELSAWSDRKPGWTFHHRPNDMESLLCVCKQTEMCRERRVKSLQTFGTSALEITVLQMEAMALLLH